MLADALDKIDKWVGRSFLLGSFLPLLIFLGANLVFGRYVIPDQIKPLLMSLSSEGIVSGIALWITVAAALAYLTDPMIGRLTKLLEGKYLPSWMAGAFAADQAAISRAVENKEQALGRTSARLVGYKRRIDQETDDARAAGLLKPWNGEPQRIDTASRLVMQLEESARRQKLIPFEELEAAGAALLSALRSNCADETLLIEGPPIASAKPRDPIRDSRRLAELHEAWPRLVAYAYERAITDYSQVVLRKQTEFGSISPKGDEPNWILTHAATRLGDHAAALRSFFEKRFKFDYEFFWPVFQMVIQNDAKASDALADARQRLDFCVRILLYTILFTVIWLPVGAFYAASGWIILAVGVGGFLLAWLWLEMVNISYRMLADLTRFTIITKRFEVLKQLKQPIPTTWADEQALWDKLNTQLLWGSDADIGYVHDK